MVESTKTYIPIPVKVSRINEESPDRTLRTYDLEFVNKEDRFDYMPGQFCQLSIFGKGESPLGIASSPTETDFLRFTVNRVGVVTTAIHYLEEGDELGVRGPLGNYYPVEKFKGQNVVIVSGGFAFTTLRSLVVYMLDPAHRGDYKDITVIYGARTPDLLIYKDELEKWETRKDINVHLTIDKGIQGWKKHVGFVPSVTKEIAPASKDAWVVVCGPPIMIKYTLPVLTELGFPSERIYTSLERRMKCGIGKCGRCNIGAKYICLDGPVFSLAELEDISEPY
ncbi:FAD/NAD(P)-binding protein [bacterium]|nr:FAD/NAD(P)-binding protein [bacterium]